MSPLATDSRTDVLLYFMHRTPCLTMFAVTDNTLMPLAYSMLDSPPDGRKLVSWRTWASEVDSCKIVTARTCYRFGLLFFILCPWVLVCGLMQKDRLKNKVLQDLMNRLRNWSWCIF
jgi:hypothetical protein